MQAKRYTMVKLTNEISLCPLNSGNSKRVNTTWHNETVSSQSKIFPLKDIKYMLFKS